MSKRIKEIKIGKKFVGEGHPPFIIAEAGVNHNGNLNWALDLVDTAVAAGADAIKFQTFKASQVVTKQGGMAAYQKKNTGKDESQIEMLKKLEFAENWYGEVMQRCKEKNIIFFSSAHGSFESVDLLQKIKTPAFKFGSGDLDNIPVLQYAAKFQKPMILGTGMATMTEVKDAIKAIKSQGNNKIVVLHCTTNYPCPLNQVNLNAMLTMMKELDVLVGYSDHTIGTEVPVMATTLGSVMIEKHFTTDNNLLGPDHKASADPKIFKKMVEEVKAVSTILGSPYKKPLPVEIEFKRMVRKSVVTLTDIKKGEIFTIKNIGIKRPGSGLAPKFYYKLIGKRAKRNIGSDILIKKGDF